MKDLTKMSTKELQVEFERYAAETGLDREEGYDFERDFVGWLEDNELMGSRDED